MAAMGGIAALPGCKDNPDSRHYNRSKDSVRLEARLLELSKTEYKGKLSYGAMCYDIIATATVDYVCTYCGDTIKGRYDEWDIKFVNMIESIVDSIKAKGYDAVLDKSELCPNCSKKETVHPELIFKIRFSKKADYHIARSNIINEYSCVRDFIEGRDVYTDWTDVEYAIHDDVNIIQKMTGLGQGIETPELMSRPYRLFRLPPSDPE